MVAARQEKLLNHLQYTKHSPVHIQREANRATTTGVQHISLLATFSPVLIYPVEESYRGQGVSDPTLNFHRPCHCTPLSLTRVSSDRWYPPATLDPKALSLQR